MNPPTDLLGPLLEPFLEGAPRAARQAAILDAAERLVGARAAALWGARGRRWRCLGRRGEAGLLPGGDRVRAVVEGELPAELPDGQAVLSAGGELALALGGLDRSRPTAEEELDLLEAFLVAVATVEESLAEGRPPLRVLELPGTEPPAALPARGIHGPPPAHHATELRRLLQAIRDLEFELARGGQDPRARGLLHARLDRACERVGDLLLGETRHRASP